MLFMSTNDKESGTQILLSVFLFYAQLLYYKYLILCSTNLHHEDQSTLLVGYSLCWG